MVYLSPKLEALSYSIVIAVVSHELAHIALGHSLYCNVDDYERQEEEAWEKARQWGFSKEIKIYFAMIKRRETLEAAYIEKKKNMIFGKEQ